MIFVPSNDHFCLVGQSRLRMFVNLQNNLVTEQKQDMIGYKPTIVRIITGIMIALCQVYTSSIPALYRLIEV